YLPSVEDILQARAKMTAITETRFPLGQLSIHMVDASSPRTSSSRRASFDGTGCVISIIFCTALLECDQVLLEERSQVQPNGEVSFFKSVISSRFLHTIIILFLNKIDVFKNKLPK
ncbi:guanine nucleotide binding protein, alpha subunit, partial [Lactarius sanguifluus]